MRRLLFLWVLLPALTFAQIKGQVGGAANGALRTSFSDKIGGQPFNDDYLAVYDAFTTKPDAATKVIQNALVVDLGTYWDSLDYLNVYAVHTNGDGEALIDWKLPDSTATAVNSPTFTASQGFLFNGTTQYINSDFTASVDGVQYTQNSASAMAYIRNNIQSNVIFGVDDDVPPPRKESFLYSRFTDDKAYIMLNGDTAEGAANVDSRGMYIISRTGASIVKLYRNKIAIINGIDTSVGLPGHSYYVGALNNDDVAASFSAYQISMFAAGAGLSQTAVTAITNAFETYMDALGTGVIP